VVPRDRLAELKARFQDVAVRRTVEELYSDLQHLPYEPYAPVRCQLCGLVRAINRRRKVAGLDPFPSSELRLRRSPVRPFDERDETSGREKVLQICGAGRESQKARAGRGQEPKWEIALKPEL
jgi:hypothetical protein